MFYGYSSETLTGWVGVREPRERLEGPVSKSVTLCPTTQVCTSPLSHHPPAAHELGPTCERGVGALRGSLRHPALVRVIRVRVRARVRVRL